LRGPRIEFSLEGGNPPLPLIASPQGRSWCVLAYVLTRSVDELFNEAIQAFGFGFVIFKNDAALL
jgi:hypothetical protein